MPIHPKTYKAFEEMGVFEQETLSDKPRDMNLIEIDLACTIDHDSNSHATWTAHLELFRETSKETGKPIIQRISAAKRVLHEGKEFVLVTFEIEGTNYFGEKVTERWREKGRYHMPEWAQRPDYKKLKMAKIPVVDRRIPVYEYEFKGEKTKIEDIDGKMRPITDFENGSTKWHILDNKGRKLTISREEFMTGVRDELIKKHDGNPVISALDDLTRAMTKAQQVSAMVQSGGDKIEAIPPPQ